MPVATPPSAITLKAVGHKAADGAALFSGLDVSFPAGRTGLVGRNGVGKSTLLKLIAGTIPLQAGAIAVSGSLRMLARNPIQIDGGTVQDLFGCREAFERLARIVAGNGSPEDVDAADWSLPARFADAVKKASVPDLAPDHPLAELSGGQVTRAALAALTFDRPDFILLDEPTNNLDAEGRAEVCALLHDWRRGALVVSHDRALLNEMDQIADLTSLGLSIYGGNWDAYSTLRAQEIDAALHRLTDAERNIELLDRKAQQQKERKARKDSRGKASRSRGDAPKILLDARQDRAERTSGDNANLASCRRAEAEQALTGARSRLEVLVPAKVSLPATALPANRQVLTASGLSGGYVAGKDVIAGFGLSVIGPERLALVGPNGSGKSTLLRLLTGTLLPSSGMATIHVPFAMLDQSVSMLSPALSVRDNYRALNPQENENACRAALARLRFRAAAADKSVSALSGGQRLSAGLACTIGSGKPPQLLILDEPTNHLDLDALAALEAGLVGYDGALLVVSHDAAFLNAIAITRTIALP